MRIDAARILERRRTEQRRLVAGVEAFAAALDPALGVRAVVVFGSVARGDFNVWSDVDVLVVADHLPDRSLDRLDALGPLAPSVQPVVWTPVELRMAQRRRDPIAVEAAEQGVWVVGDPEAITTT